MKLNKKSYHIHRPIIIDRFKVKLDELIGKPYGFKYEIKDQQFRLLQKHNNTTEENQERVDITKDNRNIVDNSLNQKLSRDDIEKLKIDNEISGDVRKKIFF